MQINSGEVHGNVAFFLARAIDSTAWDKLEWSRFVSRSSLIKVPVAGAVK